MQTSPSAGRLSTVAKSNSVRLYLPTEQIVLDSQRLVNFSKTGLGPTWAAPDQSTYTIQSSSLGDYISKGTPSGRRLYRSHTGYRAHVYYRLDDSPSYYRRWTLGYQNLGVNSPVVLPDSSTHTCYVSSVAMDANTDLICFYGRSLRSCMPDPFVDDAVYAMRVFDDGNNNVYWSQPEVVCHHAKDIVDNVLFFVSFPRIQIINSEYWILALEVSLYATIETYHLCYFRSSDGIHWSDREYLAGSSTDTTEQLEGINCYDDSGTPTAFTYDDLLHAYLSVSGTSTYIVSNGGHGNFVCDSTSLVGITNPAKRLDITENVGARSLSKPQAPTAGHGSYTLMNPGKMYNGHALLDSRYEDIRLIHKFGYITDSPTSGDGELVTVATELLDQVEQSTELGKNVLEVKTQDFTKKLSAPYWESDMYWEWEGPKQVALERICDLTSFNIQEGAVFLTNSSGELSCGTVDQNQVTPDNLAYVAELPMAECFLETEFKATGSWSNHWAGFAFQGVDERTFWCIRYNGNVHKFQLLKSISTKKGHKIRKYETPLQQSSTINLSVNTWYWLRMLQWHDRVLAWYSTDGVTWVEVIDYRSVSVATKHAYVGLVGKATANLGQIHGNINYKGSISNLDSGGGSPYTVALKITTQSAVGVLKKISIIAAQTGFPEPATIGIAEGSPGSPADITDEENILYSQSVPAGAFNTPDMPGWLDINVGTYLTLEASTTYWLFITFQGTLSGGQTWGAGSQSGGTYPSGSTKISSDGGRTWTDIPDITANLSAYATIDYERGRVKYRKFRWTSGEMPLTLETVAKHIVAKPGILGGVFDDATGNLGDCVVYTDVNLSGAAGVQLRGATGYKIELDPSTQKINFYVNSVLTSSVSSVMPIPSGVSFHLAVFLWKGFIYVYINEALAGIDYDNTVTVEGAVSTFGSGTFTNTRVPDMTSMLDYVVINDGDTAQGALDALNTPRQFHWFINYEGNLRASTYTSRTALTTYDSSLTALRVVQRTQTQRWTISEWIPRGNYYATRWFASLLQRVGRRVSHADYAIGSSDKQAYNSALVPAMDAEERSVQFKLETIWNPALEPEDTIHLHDTLTGTDEDVIVNDIEAKMSGVEQSDPMMTVGLRRVAS